METKLIINKDYVPKLVENLSEKDYYEDATAVNSSSLKFIFHSEKAWYNEYTKAWSPPKSEAMEFGKLIHKIVLEGPDFLKRYVIEPVFEGLTAKGEVTTSLNATSVKNKRNEWLQEQAANDRIVCTQEEFDKARWMVDSFLEHKDAFNLIKNGKSEVSGYAANEKTGILTKARADFLSLSEGILVDLKTCVNIKQDYFLKRRVIHEDHRYDLQLALYKNVFDQYSGNSIKYVTWIVLGNQKPFECAVYFAPKDLILAAETYYNYAMKKISIAVKRKSFLPYQTAVQELILPEKFSYLDEAMRIEG